MRGNSLICMVGLCYLVVAFSSTISLCQEETKNAVDTTIRGKRLVLPFYEKDVQQLSPESNSFSVKVMKQVSDIILNIAKKCLIERRYTVTILKSSPKIYSTLGALKTENDEMVATNRETVWDRNFVTDAARMLKEAMAASSVKDDEIVEYDSDYLRDTYDSLDEFMHILTEGIRQSPVGIYVDWANVTIDDKTIRELASSYIRTFKKAGYGTAMKLFEILIGFLQKLKRN